MKNINLNSLRMFVSAARHGSFLRAGSELNISQGAVSQRIKQLELELGATLFERGPRGVSLTTTGKKFAQTVETSLSMIAAAASEIQGVGEEITLHISPSMARKWLMPRLAMFAKAHPEIRLSIEAREEVLNRPFIRNEVVMRHAKSFRPVRGQDFRRLIELELVAVCSPHFPNIKVRPSLEKILAMPLIQDAHCRWDRLLGQRKTSAPLERLTFNTASLAIDAAINMQGIAIVPLLLVEQEIADGRLVEIWRDTEPSGEYLYLIWPKQQAAFKPLMNTVRWIHSEFGLPT